MPELLDDDALNVREEAAYGLAGVAVSTTLYGPDAPNVLESSKTTTVNVPLRCAVNVDVAGSAPHAADTTVAPSGSYTENAG